tara:strand:+ start:765 stop:1001 length:237 start_codon:yes stop_codon:yes gene_type:complete
MSRSKVAVGHEVDEQPFGVCTESGDAFSRLATHWLVDGRAGLPRHILPSDAMTEVTRVLVDDILDAATHRRVLQNGNI